MLLIVGAIVVLGAVIGGFVFEGGHVLALNQPAEYIIIGGSAIGTLIMATPLHVLTKLVGQVTGLLKSPVSKADYLDLLSALNKLFRQVQQGGMLVLEPHFEKPAESAILSQHPKLLANHHALCFLSDSVKVLVMGGISALDLEALMDEDLEVHHEDEEKPAAAVSKIADALPALGIVAAVLGIVLTMEAIDGPIEEIGHKVGAALVGTFLGILLSYGFAQPLATALEHRIAHEGQYIRCIRAGVLALHKGLAPQIAVEFARRVIPGDVRPTFEEAEEYCRGEKTDAQKAA